MHGIQIRILFINYDRPNDYTRNNNKPYISIIENNDVTTGIPTNELLRTMRGNSRSHTGDRQGIDNPNKMAHHEATNSLYPSGTEE